MKALKNTVFDLLHFVNIFFIQLIFLKPDFLFQIFFQLLFAPLTFLFSSHCSPFLNPPPLMSSFSLPTLYILPPFTSLSLSLYLSLSLVRW